MARSGPAHPAGARYREIGGALLVLAVAATTTGWAGVSIGTSIGHPTDLSREVSVNLLAKPATNSPNWTTLSPTSSPQACQGRSMAYDPAVRGVILWDSCGTRPSTWEFQRGNWTKLSTARQPDVGGLATMAYDVKDRYLVLFGGYRGTVTTNYTMTTTTASTWKFQNGSWSNISPVVSPPARGEAAMTYDTRDGYIVLFGGAFYYSNSTGIPATIYRPLNDTWTFSNGSWTNITRNSARAPLPLLPPAASMSYDAKDRYVLLLGVAAKPNRSSHTDAQTWSFVAGHWRELRTTSVPAAYVGAGVAYDPILKYVVLTGGSSPRYSSQTCSGGFCDQTWTYSKDTWVQLPGAPGPGQEYPFIAYDGLDHYVVSFGGYSRGGLSSATLVFQ